MTDFVQANADNFMHLLQLVVTLTVPYVIWYTFKGE